MARTEDNFVVEDKAMPARDEEVKPLPEDVDEDNIDDAVSKDPELQKDLSDGIDESNIIDETTRGAKPDGGYKEPSDDVSDLVDE
ncbi:hypothetical protein C2857_002728 [Epichloe festucae Fl1]|uniref:Uncharacterized protein n=1 Tax=Epichloe festucae (strain Fl1) TaxID=877507 RepID=A0A7S9KNL1_EPIFF|nr:hypothetical protein C2857_002728 [Epichloe festucae Fl1]